MAAILQVLLLAGVLIPLASFVFLAFRGSRLGGGVVAAAHAGGHGHGPRSPGEPLAGWVATSAIGASLLLAVVATFIWAGGDADARRAWSAQSATDALTWLQVGPASVQVGVNLDSITLIVYLMVTICATCIHVFSIGYMSGDSRFARFFCFLSLFCFSMLGLVIARDLLLLFVFWELVGVCSYFLIGFWFEKRSASNAAIKAFVTNRVGDFGFVIGLGLCLVYLGDWSLTGAASAFEAGAHAAGWTTQPLGPAAHALSTESAARAAALFQTTFWGVPLATWMGIGLFCGAIGKSAQFPLQVWLPDAMEGPTPVSALIHAATMVAAGVYLVARIFTLLTPGAQEFIAIIGCITLTMAALIALVQTDIKRVLAYSTLSQLGYMIFGLGVGSWIGALYHLLAHAFFKALLFLGAGQVIAGCHHEQDLRRMGGLASKMPNTALTMLIAVLAISGAGLPWLGVGLGGYHSKDEILAVAFTRHFGAGDMHDAAPGQAAAVPVRLASDAPRDASDPHTVRTGDRDAGVAHSPPPPIAPISTALFWLPLITAYITPFYMGRCYVLAFLGRPRDAQLHEHAHESPLMVRPLLALAGMTIVSSIPVFLFRPFVAFGAPQSPPLAVALDSHDPVVHGAHAWLPLMVGFAWVVGLGSAWWLYRGGLAKAEQVRRLPLVRPLHAALSRKLFFDVVYGLLVVGGTKAFAVACRLFDEWVVDSAVNTLAYLGERVARFSGVVLDQRGVDGAVNGLAGATQRAGSAARRLQTGLARNYLLLGATGVCAAILAIGAGGDLGGAALFALLAGGVLLTPWRELWRRLAAQR